MPWRGCARAVSTPHPLADPAGARHLPRHAAAARGIRRRARPAASASSPGAARRFPEAPGPPGPAHGLEHARDRARLAAARRHRPLGDYAYFVHSYALPLTRGHGRDLPLRDRVQRLRRLAQFLWARNSIPSAPRRRRAAAAKFSGSELSVAVPCITMRLIPAIDLKGGRCVRLLQRRLCDARRATTADPLELLAQIPGLGADWLHVVDLDGARDGSVGSGQPASHRRGSPASRASSCRSAAACAATPRSSAMLGMGAARASSAARR